MVLHKKWFLSLLLMLALILAACSGGDEGSQGAEEGASNTAEATESEGVAEPELEAEPTPTEEALDLSNAKTLDEIADINSFRLRINIQAEGDAFATQDGAPQLGSGINIEGAFVKEPAAQHIVMALGDDDQGLGNLEFIQVDNKGYANFTGEWIEAPIEQAPSIEDLAFMTPADLADGLHELERVGDTETLNGRDTVHLHADKETFAKLNTGDEQIALDEAEEVELDLWFDQADGFIVKMQILAQGKGLNEEDAEATGRVEMTLEYYDFNENIVIETPETSG